MPTLRRERPLLLVRKARARRERRASSDCDPPRTEPPSLPPHKERPPLGDGHKPGRCCQAAPASQWPIWPIRCLLGGKPTKRVAEGRPGSHQETKLGEQCP